MDFDPSTAQPVQAPNASGFDPSTAKPVPASWWVDAVRSIPGGLAKGAATVAGLPGDVEQLTSKGLSYLTGVPSYDDPEFHLPTSDQVNKVVSKPTGGYYQPKTDAGRYAETIASFAPAAFGGEASILARVARVVLPAVGSQAAGDFTEGTPLQPYAQVGGALLGGGGAMAVDPLINVTSRAVNAIRSAATDGASAAEPAIAARARLAQAIAKDGGIQPAIDKAQTFATSGSSAPALIDAGGNNVRRLVRAAASADGPGQNLATGYADQIRANLQDNLINRTNQLTPDVTAPADSYVDQLTKAQAADAKTNYAQPYSQPAAVTPEMVDALQGPDGQRAINVAYATARANRDAQAMGELSDLKNVAAAQSGGANPLTGKKQSLATALGELSSGSLDRVRIAMREIGSKYAANQSNGMAAGYFGRMKDIDTALDQTPGLTDARAAYRGTQAQIDAVPVGQSALNLPADQYSAEIQRLSTINPDANAAAAVGHRQAIVDAVSRPAAGQTGIANRLASSTQQTKNLATSFGPDAASNYQTAVGNEVDRLRNANFISPNAGSQTDLRNADRGLVGVPGLSGVKAHFIYTIWNRVTGKEPTMGLLTPQEKAEIVRLGISQADLNAFANEIKPKQGVIPSIARIGLVGTVADQQQAPQ